MLYPSSCFLHPFSRFQVYLQGQSPQLLLTFSSSSSASLQLLLCPLGLLLPPHDCDSCIHPLQCCLSAAIQSPPSTAHQKLKHHERPQPLSCHWLHLCPRLLLPSPQARGSCFAPLLVYFGAHALCPHSGASAASLSHYRSAHSTPEHRDQGCGYVEDSEHRA